jgi:hypothetical protein
MTKSYADICIERAEKATEGPWVRYHYAAWDGIEGANRKDICCMSNSDWEADGPIADNIQFIAHAREDVPELAKRLKKCIARIRFEAGLFPQFRNELNELADELEAIPKVEEK